MTDAKQTIVQLPQYIVVRDLAQKIGVSPAKIVAMLVKNGVMANMNERIDFDTASILADDLGVKVELLTELDKRAVSESQKGKDLLSDAATEKQTERPPVVVVMGHVDHGKTTLLDVIRDEHVAEGESGGITQHIGAYQVEKNGRLITFIDTPGHEAFSAMRSRGANVADIAILVVAADDGLQPQTKEAISLIKKAGLAFVVAINKIDKPEADVEKVKGELAAENLVPEAWGGDTMIAEISAKKKIGITELLDTVLLVSDVNKSRIVANPDRAAIGTIIETHVDKGEGPVATAIIQTGTLKVGDYIQAGDVVGKVKALRDYTSKFVGKAGPSMPVKILGLRELPQVGDVAQVVSSDDVKNAAHKKKRSGNLEVSGDGVKSIEAVSDEAKKVLPMILKADTVGSLEAIVSGLSKIQHPEVTYKILYKTLGNITEKDVLQTEATGAMLLGFNVLPTGSAQDVARSRGVSFTAHTVLYELLDEVKKQMEDLLDLELVMTDVATLDVKGVFRTEKTGQIIGGRVKDGEFKVGAKLRFVRNGEEIGRGVVTGLQQAQEKVKQVTKGVDCGLQFKGDPVVATGDSCIVYVEEMRRRTITA